ncbi:hypothetical protein PO909_023028 [Leuciscus waleckii]
MSPLCFLTGPSCDASNSKLESQLRNNAQEALRAIGSNRTLKASYERAKQGQHVFNKGLLKFHCSVLEDLLEDVGGYHEQLKNLVQDLMIPLNQSVNDSISTMVANFGSVCVCVCVCVAELDIFVCYIVFGVFYLCRSDKDEFYVDFNACVFGEYVRQLRMKLVAYLKADTSPNEKDRYGIQKTRRRINSIAREMVDHVVYLDPMARDHWLNQNKNQNKRKEAEAVYDLVKRALKEMFQNILQAFQKVSDKIRVFRMRNNWSWKRLDK